MRHMLSIVNNTLAVKTPMKIVLDITLTKTNDILRRGATIRLHFSIAGATKLDENPHIVQSSITLSLQARRGFHQKIR